VRLVSVAYRDQVNRLARIAQFRYDLRVPPPSHTAADQSHAQAPRGISSLALSRTHGCRCSGGAASQRLNEFSASTIR
jgi:hypothetical protein